MWSNLYRHILFHGLCMTRIGCPLHPTLLHYLPFKVSDRKILELDEISGFFHELEIFNEGKNAF